MICYSAKVFETYDMYYATERWSMIAKVKIENELMGWSAYHEYKTHSSKQKRQKEVGGKDVTSHDLTEEEVPDGRTHLLHRQRVDSSATEQYRD